MPTLGWRVGTGRRPQDGADGRVLWQTRSSSATQVELPVIADVDADGNAEIVKVTNDFDGGTQHGVQVYGDADDNWVSTRRIWNQHTYHVDNVNDDGSIPRLERPSWTNHNTYRLNLHTLLPATAAPDLTAARLVVEHTGDPARIVVRARIGNGGAVVAPVGTLVAFYDGPPGTGARLIGTVALPGRLAPGEWMDLGVEWGNPLGSAWEVHVVADDDGQGHGTVSECDETNNHHWWSLARPATPTPAAMPSSTATPVPGKIHLPILNLWQCVAPDKPADVVLLIDASSSTDLLTNAGRPKIDVAKEGAHAFVTLLRDADQVAVVAFNDNVTVESGLTGALAATRAAIDDIRTDEWTRIDLGLDAAREELGKSSRRASRLPMIVLLTDGHPTYTTEDAVREAADRARSDGATIHAIAVGPDPDPELLIHVAGDSSRYYATADAEDLHRIFAEIARTLPCVPPWEVGGT